MVDNLDVIFCVSILKRKYINRRVPVLKKTRDLILVDCSFISPQQINRKELDPNLETTQIATAYLGNFFMPIHFNSRFSWVQYGNKM